MLLDTLSFPLLINSTAEITGINITTGNDNILSFSSSTVCQKMNIFEPYDNMTYFSPSLNLDVVCCCLPTQCVHQIRVNTSAGVSRALLGHTTAA